MLSIVNGNSEHKVRGIISHDEYRPGDKVLSRDDPVDVDEGESALHRGPKPTIVSMVRISATVSVA